MKNRNLKQIKRALLGVLAVALLLFLFSSISCSLKQKDIVFESKYSFNLDEKKESIPLSTFFKNPETIILETNNDCLIGRIDELQVFDGCIYVLDMYFAKSLLTFDKDGRFIRKIGGIGNGPGEYIKLLDFTLDTENRFIFLLDYGQRVHKYQLDGTFIQTITPNLLRSNITNIQYYKKKLYLNVEAFNSSPDDYMLIEVDPDNGKIYSSYLPLHYNKGWDKLLSRGHSVFMSRLNSPPLYTRLFMDYIVAIGEETSAYIELKSKFLSNEEDLENFPEITDFEKFSKAVEDFSKVWDVHSYVENYNFIMFWYRYDRTYNNLIFNKKTHEVRIIEFFINDLIFRNDQKGFRGFAFSDSKGSYSILQNVSIKSFQTSIKNNEVVYDFDKLDQLMKLDDDSNPVIFFYEFK